MAGAHSANTIPDAPRMPEHVASSLHQKALALCIFGGLLLAVGYFLDTTPPKLSVEWVIDKEFKNLSAAQIAELREDPSKLEALGYTWEKYAPAGHGYNHSTWFFCYLHGFMLALSISLGSLFWNMIHHVTDAGWSVVIRRNFENVTRALPILLLLSLPILLGLGTIYKGSYSHVNPPSKEFWLSKPFFIARILFYFAVWIGYSRTMRNWSLAQDKSGSVAITKKAQWWAPSGVLMLGLTATFAAFDLIMSLNYTWFSTIFGVYFWAGGIRSSLAFCILIVLALRSMGYLRHCITNEHLHDMGKLTFGFTVFWTYIAFDQYFLYWYGNVPEEVQFYNHRRVGTWYHMSVLLPICYFVVPFVTLLPRGNKRNPKILAFIATWIVCFHCYDQYWQIMPELLKPTVHDNPVSGIQFSWMTLASICFFIGLLLSVLTYGWKQAPMIPVGDPRLQESLHFENDEFGDPK
jgi:hypothetical protein